MKQIRFAYFGTPEWSKTIAESLRVAGYIPRLVITNPDRPQGRGMILTAPPMKGWALRNNIEVLQPEKINNEVRERLEQESWDVFIVVAYGKILPSWLIELPRKKTINVHFSPLPHYRGATPVESQVRDGALRTGVTIMLIDEKVDHGPILSLKDIPMPDPLPSSGSLGTTLVELGSELLIETLPLWLDGIITPQEQDHEQATFTRKFNKSEGELDFSLPDIMLWRTIQAFSPSPGTYFFIGDESVRQRIKISEASCSNERLVITQVIPEGKAKIPFSQFLTTLDQESDIYKNLLRYQP
jgi:methionyl-tRNA formyltransferase